MLLSQAIDYWLETNKETSQDINSQRLRRFMKFVAPELALADVTVHDIFRFEKGMKAYRFERDGKHVPYAVKTLYMTMQAVCIFFNWCVEHELIEQNPTRLMKLPVVPVDKSRDKVMSEADLQTLLAYVRTKPLQNALVTFAYQTAARTGEVCSLGLANLRTSLKHPHTVYDPLQECEVEFYTAVVDGKTGQREVGFYKEAATALRRWLVKRPVVNHDFVFVTKFGTPLNAGTCKQIMRRLKLGIQKDLDYEMANCNIQSMRHRMGHAMGDAHVPPALIQAKLGHKDIEITISTYMPKDDASAHSRAAAHTVMPLLPGDNGIKKVSNITNLFSVGNS